MNRKPHQIQGAAGNGFPCAKRDCLFSTLRLCLGICFLLILTAFQANAVAEKPPPKMSITFESTILDGTQVEFTVTKTGADKGTIRKKRWMKGNDPTTDEPSFEKTIKIYCIRIRSDGTELTGKADVPLKDPIVIFTLNRPEALDPQKIIEGPTITLIVKGTFFGLKDRTTIYKLTEKERADLRAFLENINFPAIGAKP